MPKTRSDRLVVSKVVALSDPERGAPALVNKNIVLAPSFVRAGRGESAKPLCFLRVRPHTLLTPLTGRYKNKLFGRPRGGFPGTPGG